MQPKKTTLAPMKEDDSEREERFKAIQKENERLKRAEANRQEIERVREQVAENEAYRKAIWDRAIEEKQKNNKAAIWGLVGLLILIIIGILSEF